MLRSPAFVLSCLLAALGHAQSAGPRSPSTGANNTGIGANSWSNPGHVTASDGNRATLSARGISHYLAATNFGFTIPSPSSIGGIQLDAQRNTESPSSVAVLNGWSTGLTKTVSAGSNRCLLVCYAQENGNNSRDITAMTYGGRAMTQVAEHVVGTSGGFNARLEVWMLLEAEIALASGTAIVPTYGAYTPHEYCEAFSSAVFQHVDQLDPVTALQLSGATASTNPHQLSSAIAVLAGGMAINLVMSGNNTTPATTNGGTNTYTINSGYTEGTDLYFANVADAPTSGASVQTAHKAIGADGTEQPSCTFNGSVNRWAMIGLHLQRARELDHAVRLIKGGTVGGTSLASAAAWPTSEAYASYGGSSELWGQTWTTADINAANFGAAISARVQNGTARVNHMRITVWYWSTLPVDLLEFRAAPAPGGVLLQWVTASEQNSERFFIERSVNAVTWETIGSVGAAGQSSHVIHYSHLDPRPYSGISYYRLKQADSDGSFEHSPVASVHLHGLQELTAFPNPAADGAINLTGIGEAEGIAIYTNDLRLVRELPADALTRGGSIDIAGLPDGSYLLMARDAQGVRSTRFVVASAQR